MYANKQAKYEEKTSRILPKQGFRGCCCGCMCALETALTTAVIARAQGGRCGAARRDAATRRRGGSTAQRLDGAAARLGLAVLRGYGAAARQRGVVVRQRGAVMRQRGGSAQRCGDGTLRLSRNERKRTSCSVTVRWLRSNTHISSSSRNGAEPSCGLCLSRRDGH